MTDDATPRILQSIQQELAELRRITEQHGTSTNRAIGNLAQGILQLRTAIESQGTDIMTMALAVGEQGARLAAVENRIAAVENRLASIERQLPPTQQ